MMFWVSGMREMIIESIKLIGEDELKYGAVH